jgi:hypothetical protein
MAAVLASGTTILDNAAVEPEIDNLADFLNSMGARITGIGTRTLHIEGVPALKPGVGTTIPDRIEAGTFLAAGAITRGKVRVTRVEPGHLKEVTRHFVRMGLDLSYGPDWIELDARHGVFHPVSRRHGDVSDAAGNTRLLEKPGLASAEEPQQDALAARVAEAAKKYDTVAVFLHYGTEKQTCPNARQQELVRLLTGAGADIVVGGHSHRVQAAGFLGDKAVAYGLGNFVFRVNSPASAESGVLLVTATGHQVDKVEWKPATIRGGVPYPAGTSGEQRMAQLRGCAGLTAGPTVAPG